MKILITSLLMLAAVSAHAELTNETKPFTLQCAGSEGSAKLTATENKIAYEIHAMGLDLQGENLKYHDEGLQWEQSGGTYIEPVYAKAKWLSVTLGKGVNAWSPGGNIVCAPSRNEHVCIPIKTKGHHWKKSTKGIALMVDLTKEGEVGFMSLDLGNKHYTKTLGVDTQCTLEIESQ